MKKKSSDFLLYLAATDPDMLEGTGRLNWHIQQIKGTIILLTTVFALFSAGFAFYTVFDNYLIAGVIGMLWALLIMTIDRMILCSMVLRIDGRRAGVRRMVNFLIRVVLSAFIGLTLAVPMEIRIVSREIDQQMQQVVDQKIKHNEAERATAIKGNEKEKDGFVRSAQAALHDKYQNDDTVRRQYETLIATRKQSIEHARSDYENSPRSKKWFYYTNYVKENARLQQVEDRYNRLVLTMPDEETARKKGLDSILVAADTRYIPSLQRINKLYDSTESIIKQSTKNASLLARYAVLQELRAEDQNANTFCLFITFLLLFIEMAPVILFSTSPRLLYDVKLNNTIIKEIQKTKEPFRLRS